jgi:polysaccharide pyruvyl transferase WcaK-like protein
MRIYLVTQAGYSNLGDELILEAWIKKYRKEYPDAEIIIDSPMTGMLPIIFKNTSKLKIITCLWDISRKMHINNIISPEYINKILGLEYTDNIMSSISILHFIGGGYINSMFESNLLLPCIASYYKSKYKFKIVMTGQGLMPISKSITKNLQLINAINNSLGQFDLIDVRDSSSSDYLKSIKVDHIQTCDDLFISKKEEIVAKKTRKKTPGRLVLSVIDDSILSINFCLSLIANHDHSKNEIIFLCLAEEDIKVALKISNCISNERKYNIYTFYDLFERRFAFQESDFLFTQRFHCHLLGSLSGVHGICATTDHPYYDIKHESLIDIGSEYKFIGMHDYDTSLKTPANKWSGGLSNKYKEMNNLKLSCFLKIHDMIIDPDEKIKK